MKLFLPLFLISSIVFAQNDPEDVFENRIIEAGFLFNLPQGNFLKKIRSDFSAENGIGISGSYLVNPLQKKEELSVIFIGGEVNYESLRQNTFFGVVNTDGFYAKHIAYSFRAKAKYVPILISSKFLPSISFAIGPKVFVSKMMEQIDQEQVQKIASNSKVASSYAIELGLEIRRKSKKYVKFSVAYDISNAVKIWDRNKLGLDRDYNVISPITVATPQILVLKAALVNYR
jgi:hypothetical protein